MVRGYYELEGMLPKNLRQRKALAVKRKPDWVTLAKKAKPKKKARMKQRTYKADRQDNGGLRCAATRHNN
jgi:hypothetical protein